MATSTELAAILRDGASRLLIRNGPRCGGLPRALRPNRPPEVIALLGEPRRATAAEPQDEIVAPASRVALRGSAVAAERPRGRGAFFSAAGRPRRLATQDDGSHRDMWGQSATLNAPAGRA